MHIRNIKTCYNVFNVIGGHVIQHLFSSTFWGSLRKNAHCDKCSFFRNNPIDLIFFPMIPNIITYMYNVCFLLMRDYWIPKWSINAFPLTMMKISKGTNYSTKALRPNMWMFGFYVIFSNYCYLSKVKLFHFFHYSKTHCSNSSSGCESWKTYSTNGNWNIITMYHVISLLMLINILILWGTRLINNKGVSYV